MLMLKLDWLLSRLAGCAPFLERCPLGPAARQQQQQSLLAMPGLTELVSGRLVFTEPVSTGRLVLIKLDIVKRGNPA
jgi:hypothetical protein